jgi:two-component system cell cycle sensor histidine kinase/response regulator CckA
MPESLKDIDVIGKALFESSDVGIFTVGPDGRVLRANQAMLRLLGSPNEETTALFNVLTLPTIPESGRRVFRKALTDGKPAEISLDYVSMHGRRTHLRLSMLPVVGPTGVKGIVCQAFDIASLRRAEEHMRRSSKLESLMLLAGSLAHDLNNVFTSLVGYSSLLRSNRNMPEDRRLRSLETIEQAAASGARLVEQMLSFTSERRAHTSACVFSTAVSQAISLFSYGLDKNIVLTVENPFAQEVVRGSPNKTEQMLLNVLLNARDAIGKAQGSITVKASRVDAPTQDALLEPVPAPLGFVDLAVADTGCGISPENLTRVFDPYFTTKSVGRGTGLGLSSVWGILKEIGGSVVVDSVVGKGTTFHLYLPLATESEIAAVERAPVVHCLVGRGERILLVESEASVRDLLVWLLLNNGYKALAAESCAEAHEILSSGATPVDLIAVAEDIVDARMMEACSRILDGGMPLLALSATMRQILPASPSMERLKKPFSPEQFLEAVARCIARNARDK